MTARVSKAMKRLGRGAAMGDLQAFFPEVLNGGDPLGDYFIKSVSRDERRSRGATFTPPWLIDLQLEQIARMRVPARIVDAGAGSGRYAIRAAQRWSHACVIAVENDSALAEAIRITANAAKVEIEVVCADYLSLDLPSIAGVTAFVGNPPYVRHHDIAKENKAWCSAQMAKLGLPHSQLAGLHIYFYLKSFNNDAAAKAVDWLKTFGTNQVVPTAVIGQK
jgi:hypothetical protein